MEIPELEYLSANETESIHLVIQKRASKNYYSRGCGLLSPILDLENFYDEFLRFMNDYLTKQEDGLFDEAGSILKK